MLRFVDRVTSSLVSATLVTALTLAVGCDGGGPRVEVDAGTDGGTDASGEVQVDAGRAGPACGTAVYDDRASCQACVEAECCVQLGECDPADPASECGQLLSCFDACADNDATCQQACLEAASEEARITLDVLDQCYAETCQQTEPACAYPVCGGVTSNPERACAECLSGACCDSLNACLANGDCASCIAGPPAGGVCANGTGEAATLYRAWYQCFNGSSCGARCSNNICGSDLHFREHACNYCLSSSCCDSFGACLADAACLGCLRGIRSVPFCNSNALFSAFITCRDTACSDPGECT